MFHFLLIATLRSISLSAPPFLLDFFSKYLNSFACLIGVTYVLIIFTCIQIFSASNNFDFCQFIFMSNFGHQDLINFFLNNLENLIFLNYLLRLKKVWLIVNNFVMFLIQFFLLTFFYHTLIPLFSLYKSSILPVYTENLFSFKFVKSFFKDCKACRNFYYS